MELDAAGLVAQVEEGRFAHHALRGDAPHDGDLDRLVDLAAVEERLHSLRGGVGAPDARRVGIGALQQLFALCDALFEELAFRRHRSVLRCGTTLPYRLGTCCTS